MMDVSRVETEVDSYCLDLTRTVRCLVLGLGSRLSSGLGVNVDYIRQ